MENNNLDILFQNGFSYGTKFVLKKNIQMIEMTITYHDEEIYYQLVNKNIKCDILFINVCRTYIDDMKMNYK